MPRLIEARKDSPVGVIKDFAGTVAPEGFLLCYGQALNAVTNPQYQDLFNVIGNQYGGTNNTNFVIPDLRGRIAAGKDDMGGTAASRLTNAESGILATNLGATGGVQSVTLTGQQSGVQGHTHAHSHTHTSAAHTHGIPSHSTATLGSHSHTVNGQNRWVGDVNADGSIDWRSQIASADDGSWYAMDASSGNHSHTINAFTSDSATPGATGDASVTSTSANALVNAINSHPNTQPTIIFNKIIKY
jgi:microcystin-dependent protein